MEEGKRERGKEGKRERSNERTNVGGKGIKGMRELFRHQVDSREKGGKNFGRMDKGKQGEGGMGIGFSL
jgi:hypothetical protein